MRDPKVSNVPNESKLQRALMPNSRMFLLFLIVFAVLTFFFSDRLWLSIGEGVIILLLIIYSVIMRARKRRTLERYIESVTYDTESARNNTLQNFPLPMAVFRPADSQVIWANQNFFDLCGRHKPSVDMRITDVIPEFSGRWLLEGNTQCPELLEYQGHKYQIHGNLVRTNPDDAASYMGITYWVDVTDYEKIRLEYYASRPVIAVIVIDNYDELIRGLTDRKRNELRDAIEDKLLQWCEGKGGFFRRYDRDRYLYVFEERHLDELRENKFASLLDSVRSVASPSGIRATVSVGIGRDGDSLDENYNFAILGTEMALSRGGDQAVVKNRVTFEFFGGRGGEVERRTKVKSRVMANALSQLIQDSSKVYVMGHKFSDLDTLGAAAGVCCIARKLGTPCRIVMDANKTAAGQLRDRMLHVPEYAKAFLTPQEAYLHADSRTLLVVVDTNRPDQVENHNLLEACTRVAVIDHHRRAATYITNATMSFHEPYASSACELMTELLRHRNLRDRGTFEFKQVGDVVHGQPPGEPFGHILLGLEHLVGAEPEQNPLLNRRIRLDDDLADTLLLQQRQRQHLVLEVRTHAEDHRIEFAHIEFADDLLVADVGDDCFGHLVAQVVHPLLVDIHHQNRVARPGEGDRQLRPERAEPEHRIMIPCHMSNS